MESIILFGNTECTENTEYTERAPYPPKGAAIRINMGEIPFN